MCVAAARLDKIRRKALCQIVDLTQSLHYIQNGHCIQPAVQCQD